METRFRLRINEEIKTNMGNNIEILLDDQGGIKIKNLPRK